MQFKELKKGDKFIHEGELFIAIKMPAYDNKKVAVDLATALTKALKLRS